MLLAITNWLMKWCEKRGRVFKITGTAGPDDVYLIRYYVVRSQYFNFFIHQFLRSDRDDLHDHPWDFCTYLVSGAYIEKKYNPITKEVETTERKNYVNEWSLEPATVRQNTLVFRKATDQHQVLVHFDLKESEKDQAPTTLFFSGPTKREWGFIRESGAVAVNGKVIKPPTRTWVKWTTYLGLPENTESRG